MERSLGLRSCGTRTNPSLVEPEYCLMCYFTNVGFEIAIFNSVTINIIIMCV